MFKIGLCSVTFRGLTTGQVIEVAKNAEIEGIEWGGDVHVPPGDYHHAQKVAEITQQSELEVVSYGSYYTLGHEQAKYPFKIILETAKNLKAPAIRVWAGKVGYEQADSSYRKRIIEDAKRIATLAKTQNIKINIEYHGDTLTDNAESAALLMEEINHPNIQLYWQPAVGQTVKARLNSIEKISPWLSDVHVFHWQGTDRLPFAEGTTDWQLYLDKLQKDHGVRYLLMEFVKDDSIDQLSWDVQSLQKILNRLRFMGIT